MIDRVACTIATAMSSTEEESDINLSSNTTSGDSDSDVDSNIPRHNTREPWFTVVNQTLSILQDCLILLRVVDPLTSRQAAHLLITSIDLSMKKTKVYLILL